MRRRFRRRRPRHCSAARSHVRSRSRGLRRSRFHRAAGAGGALARRAQEGPGTPCRHDRPWAAARNPPRRRARWSNWRAGSACAIARCVGAAASPRPDCRKPRVTRAIGCSPPRRAARRAMHPDRPHARRPGRDRADPHGARQRADRARRHGAGAYSRRRRNGSHLVRPLLDLPKARLVATLELPRLRLRDDPSNRDPRFTRPRVRGMMPALAGEGLDARRLALLARRLRRAEAAIEMAVGIAAAALSDRPGARAVRSCSMPKNSAACPRRWHCACWPGDRAPGDEGPVQLGKLEALFEALEARRRTASRPVAPHPGRRAGHARRAAWSSSARRPV